MNLALSTSAVSGSLVIRACPYTVHEGWLAGRALELRSAAGDQGGGRLKVLSDPAHLEHRAYPRVVLSFRRPHYISLVITHYNNNNEERLAV